MTKTCFMTHIEDLEPHDPLQQNLDENTAETIVTEMIVDEMETTPAEDSAVNTDNQTAAKADYSVVIESGRTRSR